MQIEESQRSSFRPGALAGGAILLVVGGAMLLDTTGVVDIQMRRLIAPLILIGLGVAMTLDKGGVTYGHRIGMVAGRPWIRVRKRGGPTGGLWLVGIGAWMLLSQLHLFGLNYGNSWPLFVILAGLMMVIRGVR
jgi:hypothetical protein